MKSSKGREEGGDNRSEETRMIAADREQWNTSIDALQSSVCGKTRMIGNRYMELQTVLFEGQENKIGKRHYLLRLAS